MDENDFGLGLLDDKDIRKISGGDAFDWFRSSIQQLNKNVPNQSFSKKNSITDQSIKASINTDNIGQMCMFVYSAKHKDTLPVWDRFPLIFVMELYADGFLGMNLHYVSIQDRMNIIKMLSRISSDTRFDDKTKVKATYQFLKSTTRFNTIKPCIKRYLSNHIRSKYVIVPANQWNMAIALPSERWVYNPKRK